MRISFGLISFRVDSFLSIFFLSIFLDLLLDLFSCLVSLLLVLFRILSVFFFPRTSNEVFGSLAVLDCSLVLNLVECFYHAQGIYLAFSLHP